MKKHYLCTCSYRGANYFGFQRQNKFPSVQEEIEKALLFLFKEETKIKGAGRTDAKVHAKGQTFSFFSTPIANKEKFLFAFNRLLPMDISVNDIKEVPFSFDARHSCIGKVYEYRFCFGEKDPFKTEFEAYIGKRDFDTISFIDACFVFVGVHNFQSFTTKKEDKDGFIRDMTLISPKFDKKRKAISIIFKSNGFMTYQIRLMVGALIKVGLGKLSKNDIKERLESKSRNIMSFKAPGEGLTLLEVIYE